MGRSSADGGVVIWIVAVCVLVAWVLVALPLAVAVGRAFSAGNPQDEAQLELPYIGLDAPVQPVESARTEPGRGSAA